MQIFRKWTGVVVVLCGALSPLSACADDPSTHICNDPAFRQFDFLAGAWQVNDEQGRRIGYNLIHRILDDCALEEDWRGPAGERGRSLIFFDMNLGAWHQTWIDNRGSALRLQGQLKDGEMILSGRKDRTDEFHEIRWRPLANGQIKQHWRMTRDQGKTWTDRFIGYYLPVPATPRESNDQP